MQFGAIQLGLGHSGGFDDFFLSPSFNRISLLHILMCFHFQQAMKRVYIEFVLKKFPILNSLVQPFLFLYM